MDYIIKGGTVCLEEHFQADITLQTGKFGPGLHRP